MKVKFYNETKSRQQMMSARHNDETLVATSTISSLAELPPCGRGVTIVLEGKKYSVSSIEVQYATIDCIHDNLQPINVIVDLITY